MNNEVSIYYVETIRLGLNPYFANWLPNSPRKIGDIGYLDNGKFSFLFNFEDKYNESISHVSSKGKALYTYKSEEGVDIQSFVRAGIGSALTNSIPINAHLDIKFSRKGGVFFNASGGKITAFKDNTIIEDKIFKLSKKKEWKYNWCIVTSIVSAKSTTAIVSLTNDGAISLEADASISQIDLADAALKLNVKSENNIGFSIITNSKCIPLFTLGKLKFKIFETKYKSQFIVPGLNEDYDKIKDKYLKEGKDIKDIFKFEEITEI